MTGYLGSYATLGLLLLAAVLFFVTAFSANRVLRPSRPAEPWGKRATYECGLDPVGGDWAQMQIRYYVYAYLYVLFAVEAVFLFPFAVAYAQMFDLAGLAMALEMGLFVLLLLVAFAYAWRKRAFEWQ